MWIVRFWGWSENAREQELDNKEMTERARLGLPIYGVSNEPEWVQGAAYRNSAFSQLKFGTSSLISPLVDELRNLLTYEDSPVLRACVTT